MFQQLSGRNLRKGRNHLMWVLLQFISGSIQKNPVSNKFIHFIYKWWLLVSIHLIPKAITQEKKLAWVEGKWDHKGQVLFLYCFAYIPWRRKQVWKRRKMATILWRHWLTFYSYSTQTGPYDLVFVQLAPVFSTKHSEAHQVSGGGVDVI